MRSVVPLLLSVVAIALFGCDSAPGPNQPPTADFTFSPQSPRAGTAVDFTANATDPDGQIETYRWNFGDGETGNGPTSTHSFEEKGSFNVSLTVTDNRDDTASASRTVEVQQRFTKARVTEVEVREMPFATDEGQSWDSDTGADVYYVARGPEGTLLQRSGTIDNVAPEDLPITPTGAFTIEDLKGTYTVLLRDEDDSTTDEDIDLLEFTLEEQVGTYPETRRVSVQETTLLLRLDWR